MPKKISTRVPRNKSPKESLETKSEDKPLPKDSFARETIKRWTTLPPFLKEVQTLALTFVLSQLRLMTPSAEMLLADWYLKQAKKKVMPKSVAKENSDGDIPLVGTGNVYLSYWVNVGKPVDKDILSCR